MTYLYTLTAGVIEQNPKKKKCNDYRGGYTL
jgi:hypothetical protein